MNPDQIIQWAREAELAEPRDDASTLPVDYVAALTRFAQLVASHKQEQCAKVADDADKNTHPAEIADAIRALKD